MEANDNILRGENKMENKLEDLNRKLEQEFLKIMREWTINTIKTLKDYVENKK